MHLYKEVIIVLFIFFQRSLFKDLFEKQQRKSSYLFFSCQFFLSHFNLYRIQTDCIFYLLLSLKLLLAMVVLARMTSRCMSVDGGKTEILAK